MSDKNSTAKKSGAWGALPIMIGVVLIQVVGAALLKVLAIQAQASITFWILLGVGGVIMLNVLRLVVWGYVHKHYPLSTSFPLSSLFFPMMLLVALAFGDPIGLRQVVGAVLITAGVLWLNFRGES